MPSVFIPTPQFPNVPFLLGVPSMVRSALVPPSPLPTIGDEAQGPLWAAGRGAPTWGVFDQNNNRVIEPDSVLDFDNRNEWRTSDYPVARNVNNTGTGFAAYNKVILPFEISVRMSKGGSVSDRTNFLNQIETIAGDTNLYNILTPEKTYIGVNVIRYEVTRRGASGAYFLSEVDIFFRQILVEQAQYSSTTANTANAQNAAALPAVNQGNVQPQNALSPNVTAAASSAISQTLF